MKGIILAGGSGTRLYPVTKAVSKQLLPVHDKPMIFYPLSTLMQARIKDILIISTPEDLPSYKRLLGDGSSLGIKLNYAVQKKPNGIAEAFIIGENFIGKDSVSLILGDNIFYGYDFSKGLLSKIKQHKNNAIIFTYLVSNPSSFGVVNFDKKGKPLSIEEKPSLPKSNMAIVGLYIYDNKVIEYAKSLSSSKRGELEITDLNKIYLKKQKLEIEELSKGFAWLDTGTPVSLLSASQFVDTIEKRQGIKIGCIEEDAYNNGWVSKKEIKKLARSLSKTEYGKYLLALSKK